MLQPLKKVSLAVLSQFFYLTVMHNFSESAVIVVSPADVSSFLGDTLFLPCVLLSTLNSTAPASITWQHNGATLNSNSPEVTIHAPVTVERNGVTLVKSVLELCLTELDEGSEYSCTVMQQQHVLDEGTFRVTVEGPQSKGIDCQHAKDCARMSS